MAAFDPSEFSGDEATALSEFKKKFKRAPTAGEISAYREANASAAAPAGAADEEVDSAIQQGFGGSSQWDVLQDSAMGAPEFSDVPGMDFMDNAQVETPGGLVGAGLDAATASIDKMSAANAAMLKGEIPADVSASVRRAASENSILRGSGGQAGRALSARDLGTTSAEIKQKGIDNEAKIAEARSGLAAAHENIRQFNTTRNATLAELSIKAKQQNLAAVDVERQRIATNIDSNVNIMNMISQLAQAQQQYAVAAASADIDPSGVMTSLDAMIEQFSTRLG